MAQLAQQSESAATAAAANESLLQTQGEALDRANARISELEEALAAATAGQDSGQRQADDYANRLDAAHQTIDELRAQLSELKVTHQTTTTIVEERQRTVVVLQQEVDSLRHQLSEAESHAHHDASALDRTTADLTRVRG